MLATRLTAREHMSRDFEFKVEVISDDALLPLKDVMGKMAGMAV